MLAMSRGWESKSVEQQQDAAANERSRDQARLSAEELVRRREVASLHLQRTRILDSQTSNPHRRAALQQALVQIEAELRARGVDLD
jgi:hypothetical protein